MQSTAYPKKADTFDEVHAINAMCFHPVGTFMTAGADGVWIAWDKDEKSRLQKPAPAASMPITAASYNSAGTLMAYATGYDWGQGHAHHDPANAAHMPKVMLHRLLEAECQRRSKAKR